MSALVLAFRRRRSRGRTIAEKAARLQNLNPAAAQWVEKVINVALAGSVPRQRNLGKSVITVDRDDEREGA